MDDPVEPTVLAAADGLRVLGNYPGANATDAAVDGDTVRLAHDYRDAGSEWVFYWNVGVESDRERTVTVAFTSGEVVGPWGPAVSADREGWSWLGGDATPDRERFRYELSAGERAYFAFSMPYVRADFERFWASLPRDRVARETLATSPGGRSIPVCRVGDPASDDHVVLAARHHACESTASYALEGTVRALVDADAADRCVHVVPMVDLDGVQRGDQGKSRLPHDHNRDYAPSNGLLDAIEPIYPSTAAIREYVAGLDGDLRLGIDFHSPYKWGEPHDRVFFAGDPDAAGAEERRLAAAIADEADAGTGYEGLSFDADVGFAEPGGRSEPAAFTSFLRRAGAPLAKTLEVPYFGTDGDRVTPESCRRLGRAVGRAIRQFDVRER